MEYINRIDLARQAKLLSGNTADLDGSISVGEDLTVKRTVAFIGLEPFEGTKPTLVVVDENGKLFSSDAFPVIDDETVSSGSTYSSEKITSLAQNQSYHHYQDIPSDTWEIPHDLGGYCFVQIFINGSKVESNIKHLNNNNTVITFTRPQVGLAICII